MRHSTLKPDSVPVYLTETETGGLRSAVPRRTEVATCIVTPCLKRCKLETVPRAEAYRVVYSSGSRSARAVSPARDGVSHLAAIFHTHSHS